MTTTSMTTPRLRGRAPGSDVRLSACSAVRCSGAGAAPPSGRNQSSVSVADNRGKFVSTMRRGFVVFAPVFGGPGEAEPANSARGRLGQVDAVRGADCGRGCLLRRLSDATVRKRPGGTLRGDTP